MGFKPALIASVAVAALAVAASPAAASDPAGEAGLIAPPSACPEQTRTDAPREAQVEAMRCMTAFARAGVGLGELAPATPLNRSARRKAGDVLRCDDFSHFACGRDFKFWMERTGYIATPCWRVGENLAWGVGQEGTVRSIFRAWMRSPDHRVNVLGDFEQLGFGLRVGTLEGESGVRLWAQHFGTQCGTDR